jgi:flagellar basal-body rod protein FlgG
MIRSLRIAALGMAAQQLNVDTISNNLANVNTTGYKKNAIEFQDLLYENIEVGSDNSREEKAPTGTIQVGLGNKPVATFRSFSQGALTETGNSLDVAINGNGFLQVVRPDGTYAFTRAGTLNINSDGYLVNQSGLHLYPEIVIPANASSIKISQDGVVSVIVGNETSAEEVGQIELASFINPAGLQAIGGSLFVETDASGVPTFGTPGSEGFGSLHQGYLEKSNVDVVEEMINLIVAQRAYEVNSKSIKVSDELLAMTNNLKG